MAACSVQLDFGPTGSALPADMAPISAGCWKRDFIFVPGPYGDGGFEVVGHQAWNVWCGKSQASTTGEGAAAEGLQEDLWQAFFPAPTQWWDTSWSEETARHPDFDHGLSKDSMWLNSRYGPGWVDSQLPMCDARMARPPWSVSTSVQGASGRLAAHARGLEIGMCRKLCEDGHVTEAVDALDVLVQQGCNIPNHLFYRVLKKCITHKDLVLGRRVHALTVKSGYAGNAFLATHLIGLYAAHERLEEAMRVFSKVSTPNVYNWATIIFAHARHGEPTQAIRLYRQMHESTVKPDNRIFVAVLKACATAGDLATGRDVHAHVRASAGKPDVFVQNCLVDMYAKCGSLEDARGVFDRLPHRDVVTWNAMIAGYAQQGMGQQALDLHTSMQQEGTTAPNSFTFTCLLQACAGLGVAALEQGKKLHAQMEGLGVEADVVLGNSLMNMYAKCGSLVDARRVFDRLPHRNVVTWTTMMTGYAHQGRCQEALSLYSGMQKEGITAPNSVTFVCLLQACATVADLPLGKQLHARLEERGLQDDVVVGASLVDMYAKCGSLEDARRVFDKLPQKNVVTWTAMISGYSSQGMGQEALGLYSYMELEGITPPNSVTFVCLLQACAGLGVAALDQGELLHAQTQERGLQADVVVGGSLVNMYAQCGSLESAQKVFDSLAQKNVVAWNAMITGYVQKGMGQEAISLYGSMKQEGISAPNSVTYTCLLQACATVAALPLGKQLHAEIVERGLLADSAMGSSLVNMYAKCGSLEDAQRVFDSLVVREIAAWGALVAGYTRQGDSEVVFGLLDKMRREGIQPDGITFLSVLNVCSHVGLVNKGRTYFEAMTRDYGITPTIEHYTCLVDLLGRAGQLDEALQMVKTMPLKPDAAVWVTLLGSCQKWSNVEVGQQAFEFAVRLDETDASAYVLMSNIYAGAEMWDKAKAMQAMRVRSQACKQPGQSWLTDMEGVVHSFGVGDRDQLPNSAAGPKIEENSICAAGVQGISDCQEDLSRHQCLSIS